VKRIEPVLDCLPTVYLIL